MELLTEWSGAGSGRSTVAAIQDIFIEQVNAAPERIAVVYREQSLTYDELDRKSNQLARHLLSVGVGDGDLVAVCIARSL